jgi:toxin HigB-1
LRYRFKNKILDRLYYKGTGTQKYPTEVADAFFETMSIIAAAMDIRDLYAMKSLHFEKLSGKRKEERSVRLTMMLEEDEQGNFLLILDIEDYH